MEATTIKLDQKTKRDLDKFKEHKTETYDEVIRKVIYIANTSKDNPELSQETVRGIEKARERIRKGHFINEQDAKKKLGL